MKILIAAEILPPTIGGPATWLARVGPELIKRGYKLKVITFARRGSFDDLGFDVDWVELEQNKWLRWWKYIRLVKSQARDFDFILALGNVLAGTAAIKAKKKWGTPVVLRVPGDFAWEKAQERTSEPIFLEEFYKKKYGFFIEFLKKQQIKVARIVDFLVTNSFYQAEFIKKYWRVKGEKVKVIRNFFLPPVIDSRIYNNRRNIILIIGRFINLKGNYKLLELIANWLKARDNWKLVFIGDGPQKESLKSLVKKIGLENKVEFKGALPQTQVFDFYQKSKAYLLYSLYEGSPNTVLEAMNFSLPIIATNRGGTTELLQKYPLGRLVSWGDRQELISALESLEKGDLEKSWPLETRQKFFSDFEVQKVLDQWEEIFNKIKKDK